MIVVEEKLVEVMEGPPEKFQNFEFLGYIETLFNNISAILVFFAWVKVS